MNEENGAFIELKWKWGRLRKCAGRLKKFYVSPVSRKACYARFVKYSPKYLLWCEAKVPNLESIRPSPLLRR